MILWQLKAFSDLTIPELYAVLQLRQQVFVVEQTCPYLDADGKDIYAHHLMGYVKGELVVYARLVQPGVSYDEVSIGRVVSFSGVRKSGYGKLLMQKAIEEIQQLYGIVPIRIGAQLYLKQFYESFGFVQEGEPYLEDDIQHIIMLRP